jgi:hypothetical protein
VESHRGCGFGAIVPGSFAALRMTGVGCFGTRSGGSGCGCSRRLVGGRDLAGVLRFAQDDRCGLLRDEEWGSGCGCSRRLVGGRDLARVLRCAQDDSFGGDSNDSGWSVWDNARPWLFTMLIYFARQRGCSTLGLRIIWSGGCLSISGNCFAASLRNMM